MVPLNKFSTNYYKIQQLTNDSGEYNDILCVKPKKLHYSVVVIGEKI